MPLRSGKDIGSGDTVETTVSSFDSLKLDMMFGNDVERIWLLHFCFYYMNEDEQHERKKSCAKKEKNHRDDCFSSDLHFLKNQKKR